MIIVGLTGGMGSGKTTVLKMFQKLGAGIYIADKEAKRLMSASIILKNAILKEFGEVAYKDGVLNRSYLSKIVFNDPEKLKKLNSLVHPAVHDDFKTFVSSCDKKYVIYESAIILQNGNTELFDHIIIVTAPLNIRIDRIRKRDNMSEKEIGLRLQNQLTPEGVNVKDHFIIENLNLIKTEQEVSNFHKMILKLS